MIGRASLDSEEGSAWHEDDISSGSASKLQYNTLSVWEGG